MTVATHLNEGGAQALPLRLLAQAVPMLTRHDLAALTDRLVDRLDQLTPDPDYEADHDGEEDYDGEQDDLVEPALSVCDIESREFIGINGPPTFIGPAPLVS